MKKESILIFQWYEFHHPAQRLEQRAEEYSITVLPPLLLEATTERRVDLIVTAYFFTLTSGRMTGWPFLDQLSRANWTARPTAALFVEN
jgi:hypothetical protein